jgi:hypothetical protein
MKGVCEGRVEVREKGGVWNGATGPPSPPTHREKGAVLFLQARQLPGVQALCGPPAQLNHARLELARRRCRAQGLHARLFGLFGGRSRLLSLCGARGGAQRLTLFRCRRRLCFCHSYRAGREAVADGAPSVEQVAHDAIYAVKSRCAVVLHPDTETPKDTDGYIFCNFLYSKWPRRERGSLNIQ